MKRRNAECGKLRRPLKRSKITENLYSSTFLYVRFLMVWVIVLLGDFFLEFRFEYLWPAWLLIRSLYDSYRYQGLAFCVFFMCVALTSDVVCLLFMPAQWLFFVASTYVWVQLVWQTERGVCLPTVCLWLLFIYIEASVRLREFQKNMPFHLDLCRPFAAHCIGYPVVTLGFGVKSYVSYKVRQRRQKDVERENEFYVQLLQGALPPEMQQHLQQQRELDPELLTQSVMSEHGFVQRFEEASSQPATAVPASNGVANGVAGHHHHHHNHHHHNSTSRSSSKRGAHKSAAEPPNNHSRAELEFMEQQRRSSGGWRLGTSVNHFDDSEPEREKTCSKNGIAGRSRSSSSGRSTSGTAGTFASTSPSSPPPSSSSPSSGTASSTATTGTNTTSTTTTTEPNNNQHQQHSSKKHRHRDAQTAISKDDVNYQLYVQRLECDVKRLKAELCSMKGNESDLCGKLQTATAAEKGVRMELNQLQADNEALQTRLQGLVSQRQQDKQAIAQLERRLTDEKKSKQSLESQLSSERKAAANKERQQKKEQEEQQQAQARAQARASCGETCKQKQRDMESELKQLRNEVKVAEERRRHMERELQNARRVEEIMDEKDRLVAALSKMHQQHAHLEDSLSAETKLKLELFSALGDAKRQLAAKHNMLLAREREIEDLKSKVAEVLAVMPHHPQHSNLSFGSPLDPNARIYSPGVVGGLGSIQVPTSMGHQIQIPVSAAHSAILEALSDGHGD